jgi:amino acid adenylation domain-containing protein
MSFFEAPLSKTQHEMWTAESLDPGTTAFHVPLALELAGPLDSAALERALQMLLERHEALRTTFVVQSDEVQQQVWEELSVPLEKIAIDQVGEQHIAALLQQLAARPFVLTAAAIRTSLITLGPQRHILFIGLHHLVCDGWSLTLLARDLQIFYRACVAAGPDAVAGLHADSLMEPLEYQFVDWSEWERSMEPDPEVMDYWARQFASLPPPFELDPVDSTCDHSAGASIQAELSSAEWVAVQRSSRQAGVTAFEWLNTLLGLFLVRLMRVNDLVIASPFANREREEFAQTVGCFVETVLLRQTPAPGQTFASNLRQVVPGMRAAFALGVPPHGQVLAQVRQQHPRHSGDLARVMFALQNASHFDFNWGGDLRAMIRSIDSDGAKYDLMIRMEPYAERTAIIFEYRKSMFSAQLAQTLLNGWREWINSFALDSNRSTDMLPLSSHSLAAVTAPLPLPPLQATNLWAAFANRANLAGSAIALTDGSGEALDYRQLYQRASQIGAALRAQGVLAETRIGLAAERNNSLILGLLGILAAGATYVPLDPRYPPDRLAYLAQDAGLAFVVADSHGMTALAQLELPHLRLLSLEALQQDAPAGEDAMVPDQVAHPDQAAYVIYTSGSTGQPKGCVISHRNVLNLMASASALHGYHENDVWTLFHSYSFDFSVWEMWGALLSGARLVVVPYLKSRDPEAFYRLLEDEAVTVLSQTPTAFRSLLAVDEAACQAAARTGAAMPSLALRRVIFGGEALEPAILAGWYERHAGATEFINMYGITETTVHVSNRVLNPDDLTRGSVIGQALPGWQMYLLDAALQPVAAGVTGELYIGGAGIARGYLGRPELSAERFLPDPFSTAGSRMYRSGDLARRREDGELEYLGRADQQVKIRGYRIELGEIETVLASHEAVRDAIVLALDDANGGKRLLAWLCAKNQPDMPAVADSDVHAPAHPLLAPAALDEAELRQWLQGRLPEHMMPAAIIWLHQVPLTTNGKLDRVALPLPEANGNAPLARAQTALEQLLVDAWQEILGRAAVGRHDNFFALGGDSILALRLVAKTRELGLVCSPRDVFQHPTPAALACVIGQLDDSQDSEESAFASELTPIEAWFFELDLPNRQHWNQAVTLQFGSAFSAQQIEAAMAGVVQGHAAFFWRWIDQHGSWRVEQDLSAARHACLILPTSSSDDQAAAQAQALINISDGPISVCALIQGEPLRALWFIHHLAIDTVSWHILLGELNSALSALLTQAGATPRLAISAHKTSRARRLRTVAGYTEAHLARWRQGSKNRPDLAVSLGTRGPCTYARQGKRGIVLGTESQHLLQAAVGSGVRLDELLLAGTMHGLSGITGHHELALTLEQHGRDLSERGSHVGSEIGWFTVLAPFVVSAGASGLDWLANTIEALASWTPRAIEWLAVRPQLAQHERAWPGVSFNYLGNLASDDSATAAATGMTVLPLPALTLHDPNGQRPFAHDLIAWSDSDGIHLDWLYDTSQHEAQQVDAWLAQIGQHIHQLGTDLAQTGLRLPPLALQEGMAFHAANDSVQRMPSYLTQVRGVFSGAFSVARFEQAWAALMQAHIALRTRFFWQDDGRLLQQVESKVKTTLRQIDLAGLAPADAEQVFRQALQADHRKALPLDKAPLMRLLLARQDANRWFFGWTHHHAIVDGWSLPVILEHLLALYDRAAEIDSPPEAGAASVCTPLELVRYRLSLNPLVSLAAWQQLLAPLTEPCRLACSNASPRAEAPNIDLEQFLTPPMSQAMSHLAATHGLTLNSLFQTAWALTVSVFSDTRCPCFGVTVSGRDAPLAGVERLVGLAINTLPMAILLQPGETLIALAQRVQSTLVQMQAHGHMVLPALQRLAGHAGQELFDTLYVFENYPRGSVVGQHLSLVEVEMMEQAHYPLTLAVVPGESINLRLALRGGQVNAIMGERILSYLVSILHSLAQTPQLAVGLSGVAQPTSTSTSTSTQALAGAAISPPGCLSFANIFEHTAARYPDAVAIASDGLPLSYASLDAMAEQIAANLQAHGIGPEALIAVCAARTPLTIACLLGISKAGAAFLPLERDLPVARLTRTLAQAHPALLLAPQALCDEIAAASGGALPAPMLTPEALLARAAAGQRQRHPCHPAAIAYVIYTSGSTGAPKGVEVSHRGIQNLMLAQQAMSQLTDRSRVYQFASLGFDAAISELLMAFGAGGMLCLPEGGRSMVEIDFEADLARHQPTHITLPPSMLTSLPPSVLASVTCMLVAGERSSAAQLAPWCTPGRRLLNAYGPSESTVCATMEILDGVSEPLLGHAMDGVTVLLLDRWMRPVVQGVTGELYLGGPALARGYRDQPGMTASAFVPDPFGSEPGARLYRTGDLARQVEDGRLLYVGRSDHQIKIRGQRVEPGEVEAFLNQLPQVRQARVAAWKNGADPLKLAAWLEADGGALDLAGIAHEVASHLPPGMVPSLWAGVSHWPLNSSGKVDASLLPPPLPLATHGNNAVDSQEMVHDAALLQQICPIWADCLGLPEVNGQDDFYAIGGDSISAMRISSRMRAIGHTIQPRSILENPTPAQLAHFLLTRGNATVAGNALAGEPQNTLLAPLAPSQHWFLALAGQVPQRFLLSVQLRLQPDVDIGRLLAAVPRALQNHPVLCGRLSQDLRSQSIDPARSVPLMHAGAEVSRDSFLLAARESIDPLHGNAFVCALHQDSESVLLLAGHHLWLDVISLQRLVEEIGRAYLTQDSFEPYQAAGHFLPWSARLASLTMNGEFDHEAAFWRAMLAPGKQLQVLPDARPGYADVAREQWSVSLQNLQNRQNHTLQYLEALTLQALANVLTSDTRTELLVECERHGRDPVGQMDVSDAIGWFTAAFPLRITRDSHVSAIDALGQRLATIPTGGVGFSALRAWRSNLLVADSASDFATFYQSCRVGFNFLGRVWSAKAAPEANAALFASMQSSDPMDDIAPQLLLPHPLTVEAWLTDDTLSVRWNGVSAQQDSATSLQLAAAHQQEVLRLLEGGSDIPGGPSADEMQSLLDELGLGLE